MLGNPGQINLDLGNPDLSQVERYHLDTTTNDQGYFR